MTPRWRPHTEPADIGTVALIAGFILKIDADPFLAEGLYVATNDGWRSEMTDELLYGFDFYYWAPESELLAGLTPA